MTRPYRLIQRLDFLQLLGRHTSQFFCRALAALRIVEIITNKVNALR